MRRAPRWLQEEEQRDASQHSLDEFGLVSCSTTTAGIRADPHAIKTFIYPCALSAHRTPGVGVPCARTSRPEGLVITASWFATQSLWVGARESSTKRVAGNKPLAAQVSRRDYQYEIATTALLHNTLVVLPTGLGKTLIAAVVMFNFYRWFPHGKILFLAPTRPLVEQQADACHQKLGIPQVSLPPHPKGWKHTLPIIRRR